MLIILITGPVTDGKAKVETIHVQDGQIKVTCKSLVNVPEKHRDKVKSLVEMTEKGDVKIEVKEPVKKP